MSRRTIYMGPRLKRLRRELRLTQADMANDLDISPSYVALLERNQRPVTAELLLKLATIYRMDLADLSQDDLEQTSTNLQAILRQPFFSEIDLPAMDVADIATSYPGFAEALLRLHQAHEQAQVTLASRRDPSSGGAYARDPVEEAADFLAAHRNCFPALDDSAATMASKLDTSAAMAAYIQQEHRIRVEFVEPATIRGALRFYDFHRARVMVNAWLGEAGRRFELALHIAMLEQQEAFDTLIAQGTFASASGRILAEQALRHYWAAAILMPYTRFLETARRLRHDVEAIAAAFEVSFEQAAQRLTTLQHDTAKGVPFFLIRVDPAGNVSERLDGTGLPFARMAGGCPLWAVHQSFARPGAVLPQLVELPDGQRLFTLARSSCAGGPGFGAPHAPHAIALACAEEHLEQMVYADALRGTAVTPIGIACRVCHRPKCIARSAPPIGREVLPDTYLKPRAPFSFEGE